MLKAHEKCRRKSFQFVVGEKIEGLTSANLSSYTLLLYSKLSVSFYFQIFFSYMLDFLQKLGIQKSFSQGHFVEVRKSMIWVIVGSFLGKPKEGVLAAGIGTELNRKHPSSYIHWRCG